MHPENDSQSSEILDSFLERVSITHSPFKPSPHKGVEKAHLTRTSALGSGRLAQGEDSTPQGLPSAHARRGGCLFGFSAGADATGRGPRGAARRFEGELPANFSRDPAARPGRGGGSARARPRPAPGPRAAAGPGRRLGASGARRPGRAPGCGNRRREAEGLRPGSRVNYRGGSGLVGLGLRVGEDTGAVPGAQQGYLTGGTRATERWGQGLRCHARPGPPWPRARGSAAPPGPLLT